MYVFIGYDAYLNDVDSRSSFLDFIGPAHESARCRAVASRRDSVRGSLNVLASFVSELKANFLHIDIAMLNYEVSGGAT